MTMRRRAIMRVRCDLMPKGWVWSRDSIRRHLKLPETVKVLMVSEHVFFIFGQVGLLLESPDFIETPEGSLLPEVRAIYNGDGFLRWDGPAVARPKRWWWAPEAKAIHAASVGFAPVSSGKPEPIMVHDEVVNAPGCTCPASDMLKDGWTCTCGNVRCKLCGDVCTCGAAKP
jgi:hypothetical protein